MKFGMNALAFALSLATLTTAQAGIPEGAFRGASSLIKGSFNNDAMALIVRKDAKVANRYYAILAHYDRIVGTNFSRTTAVTKWVPRLYAYRVDKVSDLNYTLSTLSVDTSGAIVVKPSAQVDYLVLKTDGTLDGAKLARGGANGEVIDFNGTVRSTWEPFVPGKYFRSVDSSGMDYFDKKSVNTVISSNGVAKFKLKDLNGEFKMTEALPGLFTFKRHGRVENDRMNVETKIAVFIDIMNWKPKFTTDELLIVDTENPENVGFFYERH